MVELHIVFRRENPTLLTKKPYLDWRQIQDEFDDYMASLGPWTVSDVIDFWRMEYPKVCPAAITKIEQFALSSDQSIEME